MRLKTSISARWRSKHHLLLTIQCLVVKVVSLSASSVNQLVGEGAEDIDEHEKNVKDEPEASYQGCLNI